MIPQLIVAAESLLSETRCVASNGYPPESPIVQSLSFGYRPRIRPRVLVAYSRAEMLHAIRNLLLALFGFGDYNSRLRSSSLEYTRETPVRLYCAVLSNPLPSLADFVFRLNGTLVSPVRLTNDSVSAGQLLDATVVKGVLSDFNENSVNEIFSAFAPFLGVSALAMPADAGAGQLSCEVTLASLGSASASAAFPPVQPPTTSTSSTLSMTWTTPLATSSLSSLSSAHLTTSASASAITNVPSDSSPLPQGNSSSIIDKLGPADASTSGARFATPTGTGIGPLILVLLCALALSRLALSG